METTKGVLLQNSHKLKSVFVLFCFVVLLFFCFGDVSMVHFSCCVLTLKLQTCALANGRVEHKNVTAVEKRKTLFPGSFADTIHSSDTI